MKKILFFANSNEKINDLLVKAFKKKEIKVEHLNPQYFDPKQDKDRNYDFVIFWGGLGKRKGITEAFNKAGVNALVLENPYSMQKDHFRLTVNNPVGIFPKDIETDRNFWDIKKQEKKGDYILLISQDNAVRDILEQNIEKLKEFNLPIVMKQHPRFPVKKIKDVNEITGDVKELIKNAYCVVTHSSNCGNIALSLGVTVICLDETASYSNFSFKINEIEKIKELKEKTIENESKTKSKKNIEENKNNDELVKYFKRLSMTDWSIEEIENLDFLEYYKEWLGIKE
jgi:hypothetical protein